MSKRESLFGEIYLWVSIGFIYLVLLLTHLCVFHQGLVPQFFGHKSSAMFDLWSIQHFFSGVIFGGFWLSERPRTWSEWRDAILLALVLCTVWEGQEFWAEIGGRGEAVATWKDGLEHWTNRFIADPALVLMGAFFYRLVPKSIWPALIYSLIWVIASLITPNCMSIQNWLFS